MTLDAIPMWGFFLGSIALVLLSVEAGFRLGRDAHARTEDEKESPASGVSGAVLGLTAFMLAFSFGVVAERYHARKALVREDANAIRTAWLRADFLPASERTEARELLRRYLDARVAFVVEGDADPRRVQQVRAEAERIQRRLWAMASANAGRDMNSDIAALYVEAINEVFEVNAARVALGLQARLPPAIWVVLFALMVFGMMSVGYHTGIAGSKRSRATLILAVSFAMVIAVIASLDRPGGHVRVTQQPLVDLQRFLEGSR